MQTFTDFNSLNNNLILLHFFQEPGTNEQIKKFATETYNVTFDMFSKINVNGSNADPLYDYLKTKQKGTLVKYVFISTSYSHTVLSLKTDLGEGINP